MSTPTTPVDSPRNTDRRTVIATLLAAFGALYLPRWKWLATDNDSALYALAVRVVRVLRLDDQRFDDFRVRANGTGDSDLGGLIGRLLREPPERFIAMSDSELRDHLRQNVVLDFQTGRMQLTQGWLISNTESDALDLASYLRRSTLRG